MEGNSFLCSLEKALVGGLFLEAFVAFVEGFARGKRTKVVEEEEEEETKVVLWKEKCGEGGWGGAGRGKDWI